MLFSFLHNVLQLRRRVLSLLLLLCLFAKVNAQEEEPISDTTITVEKVTDEDMDEDNPAYFTKVWMYDTDSIRLKQLPDSAVNDWKKDKAFWYADSVFRNTGDRQSQQMNYPPPQSDNNNTQRSRSQRQEYKSAAASPWVQTLLLIIVIGGFGGFIIYYLVSNKGMFKQRRKLATDEAVEEETEDIFAINYQREIDKAVAAGNYRYAIRLQFLRLLKNMAEKNIIQYKQDRTNLDYLTQLSSSPHYSDFFRITRNYEYSWYGHFEVDAEKYRLISNDFDNFKPGWS